MNRLNGKLRYSAKDWIGPEHGDQGGTYWTSRISGKKVYSPTNPGGMEPQGKPDPQPNAKPLDLKATGQKYAQIAREKWGDQAHAKLSEKVAMLAKDQSPEGQKKLAAVKAMLGELQPTVQGRTVDPNPDGLDHLRPSKLTPTPEERAAFEAKERGEQPPKPKELPPSEPMPEFNLKQKKRRFAADYDGDEPERYIASVAETLFERRDLTWPAAIDPKLPELVKEEVSRQLSGKQEPERYEAISIEDVRRMPGPEASAYAKGVLAMLQRQPSLRREFSLADLAYLEMISASRYSADEYEPGEYR